MAGGRLISNPLLQYPPALRRFIAGIALGRQHLDIRAEESPFERP